MVNFTNHKWPADPKLAEIWGKQVAMTRGDVSNPSPGAGGTFVCSNHLPLGRRKNRRPKKRKANKLQQVNSPRCLLPNVKEQGGEDDGNDDTDDEVEVDKDYSVSIPMQFEQLTRELEVKVYTGFPLTETFKFLPILEEK